METRGTGLTPGRLPSEWEKRPLEMTKEAPQGPEVTSRPTSRDFTPATLNAGGFMGAVMRTRPSAQVESRAGVMEPISADAQQMLQEVGGLAEFSVTGDGLNDLAARPGDDGNIGGVPRGGSEKAAGSATRVTGRTVIGQTLSKGAI